MDKPYWTIYKSTAYEYCRGCGWTIRTGDHIYIRPASNTGLCINCGPNPPNS